MVMVGLYVLRSNVFVLCMLIEMITWYVLFQPGFFFSSFAIFSVNT